MEFDGKSVHPLPLRRPRAYLCLGCRPAAEGFVDEARPTP